MKSQADVLRECSDDELAARLTDMFFSLLENLGLGMLIEYADYENEVTTMLDFLESEYKQKGDYLS